MSAPLLIGLTGAAGAGKDEVAKVLARAGWRGMAFADALRIEVAAAWAIDIRLFADRATKEATTPQLCVRWCQNASFMEWANHIGLALNQPRSPRWVMQAWGTWRRFQNPLYWVNYVEQWINYQRGNNKHGLVITDVRLANEAAMVRWRGGHLVRVHRSDLPPLPADTAAHESEQHVTLPADIDLHNDGDLQHLQSEVWRVVQQLHANPRDTHLTTSTDTGEATHG